MELQDFQNAKNPHHCARLRQRVTPILLKSVIEIRSNRPPERLVVVVHNEE